MTSTELIKSVKSIILRNCKPKRIWVYGSRLRDDWRQGSDLDIAFDCEKMSLDQSHKIDEEVAELKTLTKIDVKNINGADFRFAQRVKSSGKVIFSASQKQKIEDALYNLRNALDRLKDILNKKDQYQSDGYGDIYVDIAIKRFEFSWELTWRSLKRYFDYEGDPCLSPRSCIQKGYEYELIENQSIWLEMLDVRNTTSHVYDHWQAEEISERIPNYYLRLKKLSENLMQFLEEEGQNEDQ